MHRSPVFACVVIVASVAGWTLPIAAAVPVIVPRVTHPGAGQTLYFNFVAYTFAYKQKTGIGYSWCAGIGYQRHRFSPG